MHSEVPHGVYNEYVRTVAKARFYIKGERNSKVLLSSATVSHKQHTHTHTHTKHREYGFYVRSLDACH